MVFEHLLTTEQISFSFLQSLLALAQKIETDMQAYSSSCQGKILASLFFEPSTRTRLSFESAMLKLGGQVISVEDAMSSSIKKGESLPDTGRTLSCYADVIVMRHPEAYSVERLSSFASVPVINAGDGSHEHPTQALLDLYTIFREKKRLNGLNIGFVGDLRFGRTVHSLVQLLSFYKNQLFFISDSQLKYPYSFQTIEKGGSTVQESPHFSDIIEDLDVLYVTRFQEERFEAEGVDFSSISPLIISQSTLSTSKSDLVILHPLPRVNELNIDLDDDSRASYFLQAQYGLYVRMALLVIMLDASGS